MLLRVLRNQDNLKLMRIMFNGYTRWPSDLSEQVSGYKTVVFKKIECHYSFVLIGIHSTDHMQSLDMIF